MKDQRKFNPNHNRLMHFQIGVLVVLAMVNLAFKSQWKPKMIEMPNVITIPDNYHGIDVLPELTKPKAAVQTKVFKKQMQQMVVVPDLMELAPANKELSESLPIFERPTGLFGIKKEEEKGEIIDYSIPDSEPLFPGGLNNVAKAIKKMLEYPEDAYEEGIGCIMTIDIIIDAKGKVVRCDFISIDEDNYDFQSQVYHAVRKLKGFKPAVRNNEYIESKVRMDIHFILN